MSGSVAPALCQGLEHLGEQAWQRHLAEECIFLNSLLSGVGLPPPARLSAEGGAVPCCPPTASCNWLSKVAWGEALLSPQKEPRHRCQALLPALHQGMSITGFLTTLLLGRGRGEQCRGLGYPSQAQARGGGRVCHVFPVALA